MFDRVLDTPLKQILDVWRGSKYASTVINSFMTEVSII